VSAPLYTITRVNSLAELASAADPWNRLVEGSRNLLPSSSYAWISSYLEHRLRENEGWICYLAYKGSELVGVLPLIMTQTRFPLGGTKILRLPSDLHTVSADLVCRPEDSMEIVEALIRSAFEDYPEAPYLAFSRIRDDSAVLAWLGKDARRPLHTIEWDGNGAYLPTGGLYDTYREQLSAKFRKNQSYYSRQISKLPGFSLQMLIGAEATPEDLNRFMKVEAANWKGEAGTAILASDPLRQFYETLVQRLHRCGWLRWDFIEVDRNWIAASFGVQLGSRQIVWKPAYDAKHERLSAGTVLLDALIRRAFEDPQIEEVDLLSDYPYFSKWRVSMRPYYNVRLYRRRPLALVCHYAPTRLRMELRRFPLLRKVWTGLKSQIRSMRA